MRGKRTLALSSVRTTVAISFVLAFAFGCRTRQQSESSEGEGNALSRPSSPTSKSCDDFLRSKEPEAAINMSCSPTERIAFEKDPTGKCLDCLLHASCLDDRFGNSGQECEAPSTGAAADDYATGSLEESKCLTVLACELGVDPTVSPAPGNGGPVAAICSELQPPKCAEQGFKGSCRGQIVAGYPDTFSKWQVLLNIAQRKFPSGRAGMIALCANNNDCKSCLN